MLLERLNQLPYSSQIRSFNITRISRQNSIEQEGLTIEHYLIQTSGDINFLNIIFNQLKDG